MQFDVFNLIGLPRFPDQPGEANIVEFLASAYVAFSIVFLLLTGSLGSYVLVPTILLFGTWWVVVYSVRRRNRIAYWIGFALLMRPTLNIVGQLMDGATISIFSANGFAIGFSILTSLGAVAMLFHPVVQKWTKSK